MDNIIHNIDLVTCLCRAWSSGSSRMRLGICPALHCALVTDSRVTLYEAEKCRENQLSAAGQQKREEKKNNA